MNALIITVFIIILALLAWALFGGNARPKAPEATQPEAEPEKIFRRRASDRAIEEEFPERRRSDDIKNETIRSSNDTQAPLELPFSANSIIPDNSRFRMYKRTLINSEIYARKGDFDTAISLFNGVKERISDKGIKSKIDANIEYLNHFREMKEQDQKKRVESLLAGQQPGELKLRIEGPVPQTINIGMPEKAFDPGDVIKKISEQITSELGQLKSEIDRIKAAPDEKKDIDEYARFADLQNELNNLKDKFNEINSEKEKTLAELNRIRELREEEIALNRERGSMVPDPVNREILKDLKEEIRNLGNLKHSLDKLNDKIEDLATLKIPEAAEAPSIAEAKFEGPAPLQFDSKPVLDILDKITRESERLRPPEPEVQEIEKVEAPTSPVEEADKSEPAPEISGDLSEGSEPPVSFEKQDGVEKEKEIDRYTDAEEDPNAFELLSEIGKPRDDSTLTDEEIFEKIITEDSKKRDDSDFEIIGEKHKEEQEYSFGEPVDEKKKAEQEFYKKFIKPDRIKKRELPILKVSYDFKKLPDEFSLSREKNILEYSFYKYKPMLEKADEFIKQRRVRDAINYYKVVIDQNIPPEFKLMIKRNIHDLTEYLEKYLTAE